MPERSSKHRVAAPRRGFTLVELLLGLAITALISVCVLGLTSAAADAWTLHAPGSNAATKATKIEEDAAVRAATLRNVQRSLAIGYASGLAMSPPTGEGLLLFWFDDRLDLVGTPQYGELRLLHADPAEARVVLWSPRPWNDYTPAERAQLATAADLDAASTADAIIASDLFTPHVLIGWDESLVQAGGFAVERVGHVGMSARVSYEIVTRRDGSDDRLEGTAVRRTAEQDPA